MRWTSACSTDVPGVFAGDMSGAQRGARRWQLGPLIGAGLSIGAMLGGVSGLTFAIGVYLPLPTMAPLFVGG
jgi:hypothetical protein